MESILEFDISRELMLKMLKWSRYLKDKTGETLNFRSLTSPDSTITNTVSRW
ncbi:MAG: hypothetical protein CM15mV51_1500 [uncultured marine virus]|nr:MAG: hypothetical protein CM15mV51_1500 [uncultured marine virus]